MKSGESSISVELPLTPAFGGIFDLVLPDGSPSPQRGEGIGGSLGRPRDGVSEECRQRIKRMKSQNPRFAFNASRAASATRKNLQPACLLTI